VVLRIEPSIAASTMSKRSIKGTIDWTKYEITLKMNLKETTGFAVGALLIGEGKMWVDRKKISKNR
jgi:hypothetical protein